VQIVPTIRARIAAVNGEGFDFDNREVRERQGRIGREFAVTYRPNLDENETIVAGEWWNAEPNSDETEVSVEEGMSKALEVGIGDYVTFDISGRKIPARVASIRKLDLRNTRTAFIFVFRPGTLEKAPQTFVATVLKRIPDVERARLSAAS
jgi:putative ABC transport system permease protein